MRRLMPLLSAFMLILMLWTGSAAHAAEAMECGEEVTAAAGHYEGDGVEVPADSDSPEPHHHGVCHGHCVGVPVVDRLVDHVEHSVVPNGVFKEAFHSGTPPDSALRPPIA